MNILASEGGPIPITGGIEQLATSLFTLGGPCIRCVGRPGFNFDRFKTLSATLETVKPVAVVNAAAWTAVDLAEKEPKAVARANTSGPPAELARLCAQQDIPLIHASTDYVFSGDKGTPYVETDAVSPDTVYGNTKAEGEKQALAANPKTLMFRTSWVYSAHGKNFVRTILNAGAKNPALKNVADHGQPMPTVTVIRTEDWPTPAKWPADSRIDNSKFTHVFGVTMPA